MQDKTGNALERLIQEAAHRGHGVSDWNIVVSGLRQSMSSMSGSKLCAIWLPQEKEKENEE